MRYVMSHYTNFIRGMTNFLAADRTVPTPVQGFQWAGKMEMQAVRSAEGGLTASTSGSIGSASLETADAIAPLISAVQAGSLGPIAAAPIQFFATVSVTVQGVLQAAAASNARAAVLASDIVLYHPMWLRYLPEVDGNEESNYIELPASDAN